MTIALHPVYGSHAGFFTSEKVSESERSKVGYIHTDFNKRVKLIKPLNSVYLLGLIMDDFKRRVDVLEVSSEVKTHLTCILKGIYRNELARIRKNN